MATIQRLSRNRSSAAQRRGTRGFTLVEMIVVIGITAILMSLLFVPLTRSLELSRRGQATMRAQDEVRRAVRRMNAEIGSALQVDPPRDLVVWGYNRWTEFRYRPRPQPGALPQAYLVRNAIISMRLPKRQYYCTTFRHSVTQEDIDNYIGAPGNRQDLVALGDCPRHPGSPVETRPLSPMEPDDRVVAYFVGLENPGLRDPNAPANGVYYQNQPLFSGAIAGPAAAGTDMNTYNLYRVEFNPADPRFSNFGNADFFYDTTSVTFGNVTRPRYQWWRDECRLMMTGEASDVVRWVHSGAEFIPQSLVTFAPTPVAEETGQPNRAVGQYALSSASPLPSNLPPTEFAFDFGNWLDLPNFAPADGNEVVPTSTIIGTNAGFQGPRIQVFAGGTTAVYDSQDLAPARRQRLLGYDSVGGRVTFAIQRRLLNPNANSADPNYALNRDFFSTPIELPTDAPTTTSKPYTAHLGPYNNQPGDNAADVNGMPRGFASAKAAFPNTMIVPGTDEVQLIQLDGSNPPLSVERLRLAGWEGLPDSSQDRLIYQGDLAPDEYSINYKTGEITLSDKDPSRWVGVGNGPTDTKQLRVRYAFQTNDQNDVVRVSYVTREQYLVNCGVVEYTRGRSESLPFSVSERVVIRNMQR